MATLGQLYSAGNSGLTVKKTHMVPLQSIYIEEGFNVRDIDLEHVNEFKESFIAGEYIPPLFVEVTEKGVKVIDGHHRYLGALEAVKAGHEIARIECKDFTGSEADKIAFMITSSQGKPLSPTERAIAYHRLLNQGFSIDEIAKRVKRSSSDVRHHLQLAECEPQIKAMVKAHEISSSDAITLQKEHGALAPQVAQQALIEAKAQGKNKVVLQRFNHKTAYNILSSEVNSVIDFIEKQQANIDVMKADEILLSIATKLKQTMEIVRAEGWR